MISSDEYEYAAEAEVEDDCDYNHDDQAYEIEEEVDDKNFAVLTVEEIRERQTDDVCSICSVLSVPREVAILILLHLNWNITTCYEEWFANEERIRVREAIGLLSGPVIVVSKLSGQNNNSIACNICFENFDFNQMRAISCGHLFCNSCWNSYISIAINDGPGCLTLRCPDTSCSAGVGEDMIKLMVSTEDQKKYNNYLIRSYVENNINLKWCPAPDCHNAIEYVSISKIFDVKCDCSYSFCWNCLGEIHRPVDCHTVAEWNGKNSKESSNTEWILVNSKPCPKCKKPIEKNNGCMHMTCIAPCYHEFCWLCLGPWKEHEGSGYACNKYPDGKKDGNFTQEERRREALKESIKRYTHFYERWDANESSRRKSVLDLEKLKRGKLQQISAIQQVSIKDMYIIEAWEQIIECRRVMKWAYAYGYYIPLEEKVKRRFFEFIQGEAEAALERLHHCAEEEVMQYADAHGPLPHFQKLKDELKTLTKVTRNYFDHLVKALENGLADVGSINETLGVVDFRKEGLVGWNCSRCTFLNRSLDRLVCEVCLLPREGQTQRGKRGASDSSEVRKKVKFY